MDGKLVGPSTTRTWGPAQVGRPALVIDPVVPVGWAVVAVFVPRGDEERLTGPDGVTVEAEGIMILPRWAREAIAQQEGTTPSYFE